MRVNISCSSVRAASKVLESGICPLRRRDRGPQGIREHLADQHPDAKSPMYSSTMEHQTPCRKVVSRTGPFGAKFRSMRLEYVHF
jgi:hypothetical protein